MDNLNKIILSLPNTFIKCFLFLSSYIPLYILLIVANINVDEGLLNGLILLFQQNIFWKILYSLIFLPIVLLLFFYKRKVDEREFPTTYQSVEDNIISYIMTYITPLLTMDISSAQGDRTLLINVILFFVIGILYVNQDLVYLNPVFSLLGLNIFKENEKERYVITRLSISNLEEMRLLNEKIAIIYVTSNMIFLKRN